MVQCGGDAPKLVKYKRRSTSPADCTRGKLARDTWPLTPRLCVNGSSRSSTADLRWSLYGHEAVAAAEDVTHRRSLSQRRAVDLEAKKFKEIARARAIAEQAS
jgi:hypothetical protein